VEENFEKRLLEFTSKQAVELVGTAITSDQLKDLIDKSQKDKQTYHTRYSPIEIRQAREQLFENHFKQLANRKQPALICVHTSKGGTGKTTISTNLAVALAAQGYRVCLIDADPQASATTLLGFAPENEHRKTLRNLISPGMPAPASSLKEVAIPIYRSAYLDFIPGDLNMGRLERELAADRARDMCFSSYYKKHIDEFKEYEFVIIDTNPSSTTLNFNMMVPANLIIAVAMLDGLSLSALRTLAADLEDVENLTHVRPALLLVANGFHPTWKHVRENLEILRKGYNSYMAETLIPNYTGFGRQVRLHSGKRLPLFESEPLSVAAKALLELSREVSGLFTEQEHFTSSQDTYSVQSAA
jgi:chromosome partitioning protein